MLSLKFALDVNLTICLFRFPGQGSNLSRSSDPAKSLTTELPGNSFTNFFKLFVSISLPNNCPFIEVTQLVIHGETP